MGGGDKGGGGTTTQTTKQEFADEQKPYISDIFQQAQKGYNQVKDERYAGPTFAGFNTNQTGALDQASILAQALQGFGNSTAANADYLQNNVNSGAYTAPMNTTWNNPNGDLELQNAITAAIDPAKRNLTEDILPGLSNAAIEGGAYGGSKYQDLQAKALRGFTDQATNIGSQLSYQRLNDNTNRSFQDFTNNKQLAPALFNSQTAAATAASGLKDSSVNQNLISSNIQGQVGDVQQQQQQAQINALIAAFQNKLQEPFTGLGTYANLIQGFGTPMNSTVQTTQPGGGVSGGIKGLLGGASAGGSIGNYFGSPGAGAGIGGLLGALAGFF